MKIGLEIHQQIDSGKLFCRCPANIIKQAPDKIIKRSMKAISGELGEVDIASFYEQEKQKEIFYEFYDDKNCLVELDEEPPHDMDKNALETAIKIGLLLDMKPLDEIQVMRKTVIDGSNTSGFQRTGLVAVNGHINTKQGKVRVNRLYLEEDSARKIPSKKTVFRLDRLGIPLVEIRTEPDIKSPEQAYQVARKIGRIMRMCRVKRGLGTIRQDINISIPKGAKNEIKGVQDLKSIKKVIKKEVKRQEAFAEISEKLSKRKAEAGEKIFDITKIISKTVSRFSKNTTLALKLKGFEGLLKEKSGFSWLGKELAQVAKNYGFGGLIHSDELPNYGIKENDVRKIKRRLSCKGLDAFVFVSGKKDPAPALRAIASRANRFVKGVPSDVRNAKKDGTTEFLRPMSSSARMYPETDLKPIIVKKDLIKKAKKELPKKPATIKKRYTGLGMSKEQADQIIQSGYSRLFNKMLKESELKPSMIASIIMSSPSQYKKEYGESIEPNESWLIPVLSLLEKGIISKSMVPEIIYDVKQGKSLAKISSSFVSKKRIRSCAKKIIKKNKKASNKKIVGLVLAELEARANPAKVYEVVNKLRKS